MKQSKQRSRGSKEGKETGGVKEVRDVKEKTKNKNKTEHRNMALRAFHRGLEHTQRGAMPQRGTGHAMI